MSDAPAMIRFPGEAAPATTPIIWEAWTSQQEVVRFGGSARPAMAPLVWETSAVHEPAPAPPRAQERPPPRQRAAAPAQTRSSPPASSARVPSLPRPPTELLRSLANAQDATARAHETFLAVHDRHLQTLASAQRSLTRLLERATER